MKTCTKCKIEKPFDQFSKATRETDGLQDRCKQCNKEVSKEYRAANIEKERLRHAKYHAENKEKNNARISKGQKENREKVREKGKKFYKKYPHKNAQKSSKRRAILKNALVPWANKEKIEAIYLECERRAKETGIEHHVDHIIPLKSNVICGFHCEDNLQILTGYENIAKLNRFIPYST